MARGPASVNSYPAHNTPSSIATRGGRLTRALVAAAMLAPAEGAVAELALVLLLGRARLACGRGRRVGRHGSGHEGAAGDGRAIRPMRGDVVDGRRARALKRGDGFGGTAVLVVHSAKGACA